MPAQVAIDGAQAEVSISQLETQVVALISRLELASDHDGAQLVKRLHERLEHTRYWYSIRHERLWHWAHAELNDQQRSRYFSIVANGTADITEPPTYAQQFNMMKWRMERAEAELVAVRKNALEKR